MATTVVQRLHYEFFDLLKVLDKAGELSLRNTAQDNFRKALLLAAASYFEHRVTEDVIAFVEEAASGNSLVVYFIRNKAVSRQYHTWFNWDAKNANQFFGLFGQEFAAYMKRRVEEDDELAQAVRAFLDIGEARNRLVHEDFGTFTLEKTSEEIFQLYLLAEKFVQAVPLALRDFSDQRSATGQVETSN